MRPPRRPPPTQRELTASRSFGWHNTVAAAAAHARHFPGRASQAPSQPSRQLERAAIDAEKKCAAGTCEAYPDDDGADPRQVDADDAVQQQEQSGRGSEQDRPVNQIDRK